MNAKGRRAFSAAAALAAASLGWTAPATAVVGAADEDARFADRVVMVLTRGADEQANCSGVVLGPRVVLTAAHCVRPTRDMAVLYRDETGAPMLSPVQAVAVHPLYRTDAVARRVVSIDLALVETQTPLDARFVASKLASGEGPAIGETTILAGYGIAREGDPLTGGALRSASLTVRAPLSTILLWADGGDRAGLGACVGDSGGPLFSADGETVLAIVAWTSGPRGRHCGELTQGPLIAPQRAWIDATLARWGR
jgi:secreted trypsin-like serine protease